MRVLMLSWEYPPLVIGGLGRHVPALAGRLAAQGHDVVVLSRQPDNTDAFTHPQLYARARQRAPVPLGRPKIPTGNAFRPVSV